MRIRSLARRLVVPGALVALVGILATFQYQWLGQLSTAERERLQKSLARRASDFADAFDAELLWIQLAFQTGVRVRPDDPDGFARAYEQWRDNAKDPRLVRHVFLVDAARPEPNLLLYEPAQRRFVPLDWPAELAEVRPHLPTVAPAPPASRHEPVGSPAAVKSTVLLMGDEVVPSVPALVLPMPEPIHLGPTVTRLALPAVLNTLIVELDRDAIRSFILPALADEYLAGHEADGYRLAVVDLTNRSRVVFARGLPPGARLDPRRADATATLFSLRGSLGTRIASRVDKTRLAAAAQGGASLPTLPHAGQAATAPGASAVAIVIERVAKGDMVRLNARTTAASGWQLVLQHPLGSVDAAVGAARRRNLWISFGILAVLAAGLVLVIVNAQRSERLAAQQMDFVATVSHELRTPLAVIRSAGQNLSAGVVSDPEKTRYYGDLIENEGRRLTDMVEQVLDYAGLPSGRKREAVAVDVGALLNDAAAAWSETAAADGVQVELDLPDALPAALGDGHALRRVVDNLVANALKHAGEGRWIGIAAGAGRARGRDEVLVTVSDRGPGIDPPDLPHIFEPFYRGRRAVSQQVRGNGLGLSLVKRIVETYGGRVTVTSAPGHGAAFRIHLPAADPGEPEQAEAAGVTA